MRSVLLAASLAVTGAALAAPGDTHLEKASFLEALAAAGRSASGDLALFRALTGAAFEVLEDPQMPLRGSARSFVGLARAAAPDRIASSSSLRYGFRHDGTYVLVADVRLEPRFECVRQHDVAAALGRPREMQARGAEPVSATWRLASGAAAHFSFAGQECARWFTLRLNAD